MTTLNCKGQLLHLSEPVIMGILNITPDSFYDGGQFMDAAQACARAAIMITEGATILDIGGASSRPNADIVPEAEELNRVIPIITAIRKEWPSQIISIDTWRASVAKAAVEAGASIVNDISAGSLDPLLLDTVAALHVPYILMHMQGQPQNMQQAPQYSNITTDVLDFLIQKTLLLRQKGIKDLIIDPGFGFGKTIEHNYELFRNMDQIQKVLNLPLLVGISRKSMIYKLLDTSPTETLPATSALNLLALQKGASILRVHDVKAAVEMLQLHKILK